MTDKAEAEELAVPYKKIRTEIPSFDNEEVIRTTKLDDVSLQSQNGNLSTKKIEPKFGHHLRSHSVDQDDVQSSSGNSSNVGNENNNEEDSGNISDSSSHASSGDWQPRPSGIISWVQLQMLSGVDPREIFQHLVPNISHIPADVDPYSLWKLIINILSEPKRRPKLSNINTLTDVVDLIRSAKNIMVLTGAGVSVSCGIPDFRSRDGIYARLAVDFPDLPDPQAMFDISYFTRDPRPFFKFAKEIYPGQFKPSRSHRFISLLQRTERLLRNYTQNIDTLEQVAGISKVIQCHGSFATASCLKCHHKVDCEAVRADIFNQKVPRCPNCPPEEELSIMKPDIVFFGEDLPEHFHRQMSKDKHDTDLLIVIGSSLKVRPVALIPSSLPDHVPQILINREPLSHVQFDVELLGDGDTIVAEICRRLGGEFSTIADEREPLTEIDVLPEDGTRGSKQGNAKDVKNNVSEKEANPVSVTADSDDSDNNNNFSLSIDTVKEEGTHSPSSSKPISHKTAASDGNLGATCTNDHHCVDNKRDTSKIEKFPTAEQSSAELSATDNVITCPSQSVNGKVNTVGENESNGELVSTGAEENCTPINQAFMWKSRWKQSISKRLPNGTFYYGGGSRYIFPGAEVAPEEAEESDVSDDEYDSHPSNNAEDSSDESEEEVIGPGGLSSTKRNLRTSISSYNHDHSHSMLSPCQNHTACAMNQINIGEVGEVNVKQQEEHCHSNVNSSPCSGECYTIQESKSFEESETSQEQLQQNQHITPRYEHGMTSREHTDHSFTKVESVLPDEVHELIDAAPCQLDIHLDSQHSHSPLHKESSSHLIAKSEVGIPDTAQILSLPSSSLLPAYEDHRTVEENREIVLQNDHTATE